MLQTQKDQVCTKSRATRPGASARGGSDQDVDVWTALAEKSRICQQFKVNQGIRIYERGDHRWMEENGNRARRQFIEICLILPNDPFHFVKLMLVQGRLKEFLYVSDLPTGEFSPMPRCPTAQRRSDRDNEGTNGEIEHHIGERPAKRRGHAKWNITTENENKGQENRSAQAPHRRKQD